jgi:hypothetical protein
VILFLTGRRAPADFRHFLACPSLPDPFPLVSTQIDKRQVFDLPSPTMGKGKIGVINTHQASAAENELLIFK